MFRKICAAVFCACVLSNGALPSRAAVPDSAPDHILVVGDVHGDFDDFCSILKRAGLVNDQNHWIAGKTTLVQPGDTIDRGPKSREVIDLIMQLEKEAADAGGRVVPLLGNHEVMNIVGDLRYVSVPGYGEFADSDSEKRRQSAYQDYAAWREKYGSFLAGLKQPQLPATQEEWMAAHPPGFVEYRQAFSPEGTYGKWLRTHDALAKVGDALFVHGGISPGVASMPMDKINSQVHQELADFDKTMKELIERKAILPFFTIQEILVGAQAELQSKRDASKNPQYHDMLTRLLSFNTWLCAKDDGPLWFRGYDQWTDGDGAQQLAKILSGYGVGHIVVAHTVQKDSHIRSRFDGKIFLIDTGMVYKDKGGKPSALDIQSGKFTAIYLEGQDVLFEQKAPVAAAKGN